jgi:hypothetical protein
MTMKLKAYEVVVSDLVCGDIEGPTEAVTRFCNSMGIPEEIRDTLVFRVKDVDSGVTTSVDMAEG